MTSNRRLQKELTDIEKNPNPAFQFSGLSDNNILQWTGLLVPEHVPYNKCAFKIAIEFPAEYPFKPPKVIFKTKIYHPNVDEKGYICLPIIDPAHWKPATKTEQVLNSLIQLINEPEPEHPLRTDLAEEYQRDKKKFIKNAEDFCKKHGEARP